MVDGAKNKEQQQQQKVTYYTTTQLCALHPFGPQAMAIVDILRHFGWKYVSIVYTEDSYGIEGFKAIRERLENFDGFCLAVTYMLNKEVNSSKYEVGACVLYLVQCNVHGISLVA